MKACQKIVFLFIPVVFLCSVVSTAQDNSMKPVTPNASPEARAVLQLFYRISGKYILTGQHNFPNVKGRNTEFATEYIGKTPVIYSTDWGFAQDGNSDSYLARQDIVNEAIRQNKLGSLVTICWHAVPPTADEPVTFQPMPGADSTKLRSVQGRLLDQQFKDILTPGTELYKHWCKQVDTIAVYLRKLQDAHVPIIWRPYHEMNGDWFWWGGRQGQYSTIRLYRQLFSRLVTYHKLNNLIWLWSVDRPGTQARRFSNFYPGNDFYDIAGLDVYGSDFSQNYYDSLLAISKGKPIVLGEVGNPPTPEILKRQPNWGYYVIWAGMVRNTSRRQYEALMNDSRVLFRNDTAWWDAVAPYRQAAGLPSLYAGKAQPVNFSGRWVLDEDRSIVDNLGVGNQPSKLEIRQDEDTMDVKRTMISEYSDKTILEQLLTLDGKEQEFKAPFGNAPMKVSAKLSEKRDTISIDSKMSFANRNFVISEKWTLQDNGKTLAITQTSNSFRGKRTITLIFDKE